MVDKLNRRIIRDEEYKQFKIIMQIVSLFIVMLKTQTVLQQRMIVNQGTNFQTDSPLMNKEVFVQTANVGNDFITDPTDGTILWFITQIRQKISL